MLLYRISLKKMQFFSFFYYNSIHANCIFHKKTIPFNFEKQYNLTIFVQIFYSTTMFGQKIRQLRKERQLPQRKVAAFLDIDTSILSKIERGERQPTKTHVIKAAQFFKVSEQEMLAEFYSDTIAQLIYKEPICKEILRVAEEKVAYLKHKEI